MEKNNKIKVIRTIKIILYVIMTIIMLILMNTNITGMELHEILGVGIFLIFLIHKILNIKWIIAITKNIFSKKVNLKTKIVYILNVILLITITANVITGILISKCILTNISISNSQNLSSWHKFISYWSLIIISIHIGLHWEMLINMFKKVFKITKESIITKYVLKIVYLAIAVSGIYSLTKTQINKNFILPINNNQNKKEVTKKESQDESNTNSSNSSNSVIIEEDTGLEDYLSKLYCTGCGKHCPLTNPQCGRGQNYRQEKIEEYNSQTTTNNTSDIIKNENLNLQTLSDTTTTYSKKSSKHIKQGKPNTNNNFNPETTNEVLNIQNEQRTNIIDYISIMGLVIGGTYYIIKIPKEMAKKKNRTNKNLQKNIKNS